MKVRIVPLTPLTQSVIPGDGKPVDTFPFRIGRWSENPEADVFLSNDLLIHDQAPFRISRNHCAIDREGDRFFILDRGSSCGTIVNGQRLGEPATRNICTLQPGDNLLILGDPESPFQFNIQLISSES